MYSRRGFLRSRDNRILKQSRHNGYGRHLPDASLAFLTHRLCQCESRPSDGAIRMDGLLRSHNDLRHIAEQLERSGATQNTKMLCKLLILWWALQDSNL